MPIVLYFKEDLLRIEFHSDPNFTGFRVAEDIVQCLLIDPVERERNGFGQPRWVIRKLQGDLGVRMFRLKFLGMFLERPAQAKPGKHRRAEVITDAAQLCGQILDILSHLLNILVSIAPHMT